ncbi:MAG: hypothetical protein GF350_15020 [Chitinivibrionales bacterium]|nr:hypothetical protein [Chitinivibrionales bacterium]
MCKEESAPVSTPEKKDEHKIKLKFPGDSDYIPAVRKFIAEMLQSCNFSPKFAYRSEIIVDEVCNNAVMYGCKSSESTIELHFNIFSNRTEFIIKDPGGEHDDIERLRKVVEKRGEETALKQQSKKDKLGLEIVRMLSEEVDFQIDENNLTTVRVVRKKDDVEAAPQTG